MSAECLHFDFFHQTEQGGKIRECPKCKQNWGRGKALGILVLLPLVLLRNKY